MSVVSVCTDPRLEGYPMMSSPWPTVFITMAYVYTVQVGLPRFMADRKPYNVRQIMLVYNFVNVLLSGYIFIEVSLVSVSDTNSQHMGWLLTFEKSFKTCSS